MSRTVGRTHTTEVDIDRAIRLSGNPDVITIAKRDASTFGDRTIVRLSLSPHRFKPTLELLLGTFVSLPGCVEVRTRTFVCRFGDVKVSSSGRIGRLGVLECTLIWLMASPRIADLLLKTASLLGTALRFRPKRFSLFGIALGSSSIVRSICGL